MKKYEQGPDVTVTFTGSREYDYLCTGGEGVFNLLLDNGYGVKASVEAGLWVDQSEPGSEYKNDDYEIHIRER